MNPRPKRYLPTSDGGGVVLGWQSTQPGLPRALSWVLVPPCLPRASGGGRASALPSQVRPQPALVPYLSELSFLELLHCGGQVAGASRLVFPSAQRAGSEREKGRRTAGQRRALAPAAPCTGLGARAQALPSVGCGCGAQSGAANASLSLRRAGGWGGVHGCARIDTQMARQRRGRDGGMRAPSRKAAIGGAKRVRWGCLRWKPLEVWRPPSQSPA